MKLVLAQRVGPVTIDFNEPRDDLSVVRFSIRKSLLPAAWSSSSRFPADEFADRDVSPHLRPLQVTVPENCVGYVMGRQGQALRGMEEEWGTLMVFAKARQRPGHCSPLSAAHKPRHLQHLAPRLLPRLTLRVSPVNLRSPLQVGGTEKLAIFGTRRARRGAELKVMSAVEHKNPGHFVSSRGELRDPLNQPGDDWRDGWGYDTMPLTTDEFSYALGRGGETRKKLARAADCIMEYVGMVAVMAGFKDERKRARDYLEWLLQQRKGPVSVETSRRDDVTVVEVPRDSVGYITGHKGESLREIERQTGTFCFANGEKGSSRSNGAYELLLIFGASSEVRVRLCAWRLALACGLREGRASLPAARRALANLCVLRR